jgi:hypothetical protein
MENVSPPGHTALNSAEIDLIETMHCLRRCARVRGDACSEVPDTTAVGSVGADTRECHTEGQLFGMLV